MSEAGRAGNQRNTDKRWPYTDKYSARGKDLYSWGAGVSGLPRKAGGSKSTVSTDKFTVGTYTMSERPSINRPEVFHMNVVRLADEIAQTVVRKQKDYGPNNIRKSPFGPLIGLTVRLYDKIARLANLAGGEKPQNESLRDTFIDIAGYGLIGLMILDGTFPDASETK